MFEKLKNIEERYNYITEQIMLPEIISNAKTYKALCKEQKNLAPIVDNYNLYKKLYSTICENEELLKVETDNELKDMLTAEIFENKELRALFDVQRDMDPDDLKALHNMALALKRKERGNYDDAGC